MEEIFKLPPNSLPISVKIDSNSLDEAIKSTAPVTSKRLRRDVARIKENLAKRHITDVTWLPGHKMMADALSKLGVNTTPLQVLLKTGSPE